MNRAVLGLATDRGVIVLKPGSEATDYTRANQGLLNRKCPSLIRGGDGRLIAATEDFFIQHSKDGQEWKPALEGLNRTHITALARHPKHNMLVFAGTSTPAIFISQDYGETWKGLSPLETLPSTSRWTAATAPFKAHISDITCHPEHAGVLLASIRIGGLAASKDGGKTWIARDTGLPPDIRKLIAPPVKSRLYAGTSDGFWRSDDLGGSWNECNKGLPYRKVQALAMASSNPDLLVLSVSQSDKGMTALAQSKDGGASWDMIVEGLPNMADRLVTALTFGRGGFYAGTDKGDLFGLDNMDGRWTRLGTGFPPINDIVPLA